MNSSVQERLENWPGKKPVALLILGTEDNAEYRGDLTQRLANDVAVTDWWVMAVENHMVEAPIEAVPRPHGWAILMQLSGGEAARGWLASLREQDPAHELTIFLARSAPPHVLRMAGLMRRVLNRMPLKSVAPESLVDPKWLGGANPSPQNIAAAKTLPQNEAIGVLNMHRYKDRAIDPHTGAESSGKRIASVYIKRGFKTFMRSGGHVSWLGGNLGQLHGPQSANWQEFALIWYPGRDAFSHLSRDPKCAHTIPYRKAGMDIASVAHTHVVASSRREDLRA